MSEVRRRDNDDLSDLDLTQAARLIGVSTETLRRWDRQGKIKTSRDERNRRMVSREEVERLRKAPGRHRTGSGFSARNRFAGRVRSVEVGGPMAVVEIEVGEHLFTAAVTRDSVEELGLEEGSPAIAVVKATSVMIDVPVEDQARGRRPGS